MKKIMFVCTGNTCRSPMAEVILRTMLKEKKITGIKVSSAGVSPVVGQPIMPNANAALLALGFKPVKYRARQLTSLEIEEYDLIICMTEGHKRFLGSVEHVTTVAAITGLHDVDDPYGDSLDTYIKTAEYLKYACGDIISIIEKVKKAAKSQKAVKPERIKIDKPKKIKPEKPKKAKIEKPDKIKKIKPEKKIKINDKENKRGKTF